MVEISPRISVLFGLAAWSQKQAVAGPALHNLFFFVEKLTFQWLEIDYLFAPCHRGYHSPVVDGELTFLIQAGLARKEAVGRAERPPDGDIFQYQITGSGRELARRLEGACRGVSNLVDCATRLERLGGLSSSVWCLAGLIYRDCGGVAPFSPEGVCRRAGAACGQLRVNIVEAGEAAAVLNALFDRMS